MVFLPVQSVAQTNGCEVEDWKYVYQNIMQMLTVEGVTTCESGEIHLRLYEGEGETREFYGVETAFIEGHIFETIIIQAEKPTSLSLEYKISGE